MKTLVVIIFADLECSLVGVESVLEYLAADIEQVYSLPKNC